MNFVSYKQLAEDIKTWDLPPLDAVIGIPRSGMLPATLIALHRNIGLGDIDSFRSGKLFLGGGRWTPKTIRKVLVVDDSCLSGKSIERAKRLLQDLPITIYYGAVYVKPGININIFYRREVDVPRIFEWNMFHGYWMQFACIDIDGVLCRDPIFEENDDGYQYKKFLRTVQPKVIPTTKINTLVTSRLEKYRGETELWLQKHNIRYDRVIMHSAKTKQERVDAGDHAIRKADAYTSEYKIFIESSNRQAQEINRLTNRPVICTDEMVLYE